MIFFIETLKKWYQAHKRELPWRGLSNPYMIWVSEVMLQQTQVKQTIDYYNNFLKKFPTLKKLANANEQDVLKVWEGLGYYTRARNLHYTAKKICSENNGKFPDTYDEILKFKGIGTYSAAAIASLAFKLPYAVVDGNVNRVIARYFGIQKPINNANGKKIIQTLATQLLDKKEPGEHNQAVIDFGALQCKPVPNCSVCPIIENCYAFRYNLVKKLPVKLKKLKIRNRYFYYLFVNNSQYFYIQKRTKNDIWKNLYELPLIETTKPISIEKLMKNNEWNEFFNNINTIKNINITSKKHLLTHQILYISFLNINFKGNLIRKNGFEKILINDFENYPYPVPIRNFLRNFINNSL